MNDHPLVAWFDDVTRDDVALVGGKNASLGELTHHANALGIRVPPGFAVTSHGYRLFLSSNKLNAQITEHLAAMDSGASAREIGMTIRKLITNASVPDELVTAITDAYTQLGERVSYTAPAVAVRSSATAEDLAEASFAGQQDTFLNTTGIDDVLTAFKKCCASLFTDRAIHYRNDIGFSHTDVALSVGIQHMVRSDKGSAGTAFSLDTDSGFPHVVLINASYGLGESVVGGSVDPDEYVVFKPLLTQADVEPIISKKLGRKENKYVYDATGTRRQETSAAERSQWALTNNDILELARWVAGIEEHYETPIDVEWAKDGITNEIFVVQARPETVESQRSATLLRTFTLQETPEPLVTGAAVGDAIGAGPVCKLSSPDEIKRFPRGAVLVTGTTDPDWEPVMRQASAIVTDHGGRTSHAAIVSRELGVPAVVGTGNATATLTDEQDVTVSCSEGETGNVYAGRVPFKVHDNDLGSIPQTETRVMLNVADPAAAMRWWRLPAKGIGLLRLEFLISTHIKGHPMALAHPEQLDNAARQEIKNLTAGYATPADYFVDKLTQGIAKIAASQWPNPVITRMSDFKTNEYAQLIGGTQWEPTEANPMLGWRGASRYSSPGYKEGFALECKALRQVRDRLGLGNVIVMIPFCRTLAEADQVLETMEAQGLVRGQNGLKIYVMAEIPSNIILAKEFAERFDGFSIGSNDLTQLTLGVDRDSDLLVDVFNERDLAVQKSIEQLITDAHDVNTPVGLCGQRPSNDPDFARFLVRAGIDSLSVTPDSFVRVVEHVAAAEEED